MKEHYSGAYESIIHRTNISFELMQKIICYIRS